MDTSVVVVIVVVVLVAAMVGTGVFTRAKRRNHSSTVGLPPIGGPTDEWPDPRDPKRAAGPGDPAEPAVPERGDGSAPSAAR